MPTLDEAVDRFDEISRQIAHLMAEKKELGEIIASQALEIPHTGNTVRVSSRAGTTLKITAGSKTSWENDQLMDARNLIGSDLFDELFNTKIEFVAHKRLLTAFLGTMTSDEKVETAKTIIRDAQIETQTPPYVSVERSQADIAKGAVGGQETDC